MTARKLSRIRVTYAYHEGDILVVAAEDLQLGAGGGEDRLLDGLHEHVQDPQLLLLPLVDEDEVRRREVQSAHRRRLRGDLVDQLDVLHLGRPDVLHLGRRRMLLDPDQSVERNW